MSAAPTVVYDACVLYPVHLRNMLVQVGVDDLASPHWTQRIQDEWTRNLQINNPTIDPTSLHQIRQLMDAALPGAMLHEDQLVIERLNEEAVTAVVSVDAKDRHVLAAAIVAKATIITTQNLKDFPEAALHPHGIKASTGDDFLMLLHDADPEEFFVSMRNAWKNLKRTRPSVDEYISMLIKTNLLPKVGGLLAGHRKAWGSLSP